MSAATSAIVNADEVIEVNTDDETQQIEFARPEKRRQLQLEFARMEKRRRWMDMQLQSASSVGGVALATAPPVGDNEPHASADAFVDTSVDAVGASGDNVAVSSNSKSEDENIAEEFTPTEPDRFDLEGVGISTEDTVDYSAERMMATEDLIDYNGSQTIRYRDDFHGDGHIGDCGSGSAPSVSEDFKDTLAYADEACAVTEDEGDEDDESDAAEAADSELPHLTAVEDTDSLLAAVARLPDDPAWLFTRGVA